MIREYECSVCKEKTEFIENYDDPLQKDCPKCGSKDALEHVVYPGSTFVLKGSGWFKSGGY
jgi:putative FmdB family regulatory protein